MSETEPTPPPPDVEEIRQRRWPSVVWLLPLLGVIGAVVLLVQNIATRGPVITISFSAASGLKEGESVVRYRDVNVGRVEAIRFAPDLQSVLADVRMDQAVAPFLDESASFWIVRPQVSAQGITGLETVISGTYIEGNWDTEAGETRDFFTGADRPPPTPEGTPGVRIRLTAADGSSLDVGSPILFKGLEVGKIEEKRLSDDGTTVELQAFITAPNDRHVTEATRFWNASGVDLQLGSDGARLRIASLASLLRGGASFSNFGAGDAPRARSDQVFDLFPSETDARENATTGDVADSVRLQINFAGSVRGLRPGAAVEYRGIRIGRVIEVTAAVDSANGRFRTNTVVGLSPTLLGLEDSDRETLLRFLTGAVERGLRAKLALGSLLTGSLYVNLEDDPAAPPATFDPTAEVPELPSVASDIEELTGSVEGILKRVDALPIETLLNNAVVLLENVNRLVADENTRQIPGTALGVLSAAEDLVSAPELGQTVVDARALVAALRAVAEDPALQTAPGRLDGVLANLAAITAELEKNNTGADVAATVAALRAVLEVPELKLLPEQASAAIASAAALLAKPELGRTVDETAALVAALRVVAEDPALQTAPGRLDGVLANLAAITAELEKNNTGADVAATVAALRAVLEAPELKLLPEQASAAIASASALLAKPELGRTVDETAALVAALRAVAEDPALKTVPGKLDGALGSLAAITAELEKNNTGADLAATVAALRAVAEAPELKDLPRQASSAVASAAALLAKPELARTVDETRALVAALRTIAEEPALKAAPEKLGAVLASLAEITAELQQSNTAADLAAAVAALRAIAESPQLKTLPDQANRALGALADVLEQPSTVEIPRQIADTLAQLRKALDLPGLNEVPAELRATLASVRTRLDDPALSTALKELTPLLAETRAAITNVSSRSDDVLKSLSAILDDPGTRAAPEEIAATLKAARKLLEDEGLQQGLTSATGEAAATLAALRKILEDPQTAAAPGELTQTLASARTLLRSLEEAKAAENLSRSLAAAQRLLEDPALTRVSDELATTLAALRAVLATDGARKLPDALVVSLNSASALIDQFQRQNVAGSAAGALDGVASAAVAAERSFARVPALLQQVNTLAKRADGLLASVSVGSELNYEAVTAIREIRDAARAITDLVDLIQRRPNAIILGK